MLDVDTITTIQFIVHFLTDVVLCFFFTLIFYLFVFQKRERKQKRKTSSLHRNRSEPNYLFRPADLKAGFYRSKN